MYPEDGYQYSQFCELYRVWRGRLDLSMRQEHRAGEKLFVDYSGQTVPVVDPSTGEERQVQIFVAVLGASNYTYAEATWSQQMPDWIGSHVRAFEFFGGVPELLIPDNLKSGVTKPCRSRAGSESDLRGSGDALRHGGDSGAGAQAQGQGEGGGRCPAGATLDSGVPSPPAVLLPE